MAVPVCAVPKPWKLAAAVITPVLIVASPVVGVVARGVPRAAGEERRCESAARECAASRRERQVGLARGAGGDGDIGLAATHDKAQEAFIRDGGSIAEHVEVAAAHGIEGARHEAVGRVRGHIAYRQCAAILAFSASAPMVAVPANTMVPMLAVNAP